ncbi:MAG: hypothetical protein JWN15_1850 [Firmicutes bacterium]|nr:hypothetical protein [Bacillota bacterium]
MRFQGGESVPFDAAEALRLVQDRRAMFKQKQPFIWQWYLNLNFFVGNQWLTWDPLLNAVIQPPQDPDKPRVTENKIQPTVRQAVGKVLRQQLKQVCPPAAHGEDEVDKAKVRTQLLGHLRRTCGTDDLLNTGMTWAANTGNFFARYMWDEDAGPRKNAKGARMGDISVVPVSPFAIVVPDDYLTIDELPWIMEVTTRSVEWVREHYGVQVEADGGGNNFEQFGSRVLNFTSAGAYLSTQGDVGTKDKDGKPLDGGLCTFIMSWEKPCSSYPKGRFIAVAGGKVVFPTTQAEADEGIMIHSPSGELPYNHLVWFKTGIRFWEMGLVEPLVPLQRERNMYASMIQDALRHVARAGWIAPRGSVKKDEWSAESGAINEYTPGIGKPEPVTPRAISGEFFQKIGLIDQDMADIAGIHYRPAPGMRAAAAFALQQETDNAMAEPVVANVDKFMIRDGKLKLCLARANYGKGRTIRVAGEGLRWEVMEFDAAKMGDSDDVEVQGSGQISQDKMQRMDQVLKLLQAKDAKGEPVIDAYEARRLLDLENSENIDSQVKADVNRARYENDLIGKGNQVATNRWDNHDIHLREHYTRMKRLDFDELTPVVRDAFIQHTMAHEQAKAQAPQQGPPGQQQGPPGQQGVPPGMQPAPGQMPGMPPQAAQVVQQLMPDAASNPAAGMRAGMTHVATVVAQAQQ